MRVFRRTLLLVALAAMATACVNPLADPGGPAPLRYRDQVFSNVTETSNIVYGSATNLSNQTVTLTLDTYEPTGDTATLRPAIIWVHGGSFSGGDKTSPELVDEANNFSKEGYFNASINYRLEPSGCSAAAPTSTCISAITEAKQDAQTAVRWLKSNASTYRVDPDRIAIGGSSAGAITAMNVGFGTSEDPASGVRAAVSLSGACLVSTINAGDAPSLLFHGTADPLVPYNWAVGTQQNAANAGLVSFLITWQGAGHVPYTAHRDEILTDTRNFLWWAMDLQHLST